MQGYLDLSGVKWDVGRGVLSGTSKIIGGDPYRVTVAMNGHVAKDIRSTDEKVSAKLMSSKDGIVEFELEAPENGNVDWELSVRSE